MQFHKGDKIKLSKKGKELFPEKRYGAIIPRFGGVVYSEPRAEIISVKWSNRKCVEYLHKDFIEWDTG